jgi:hypothetical protein
MKMGHGRHFFAVGDPRELTGKFQIKFTRTLNMKYLIQSLAMAGIIVNCLAAADSAQNPSNELKARVDALMVTAYQLATAKFPCKLKAEGKPKMLRWQNVENCLTEAEASVDWEGLSQQLQKLRGDRGVSKIDISLAVESALAAHAVPYEKVFSVKDTKALLPLSNTLLKFLPPGSLQNLPVFDKSGERVGTFAGVYSFEKSGGLNAANNYRMSLFQYIDTRGSLQSPSIAGRLLLDSFGVPWADAVSQPGFRLTADKLASKR